MDQRSTEMLNKAGLLDLSDLTDPTDRLVRTMSWIIEQQHIESLGWWEHTADWDLEFIIRTTDGTRVDILGNPGYHLVIDGKKYMPWTLMQHATEIPIDFMHEVHPMVTLHITDGMVYGDDDEVEEVSLEFNLQDLIDVHHGRG